MSAKLLHKNRTGLALIVAGAIIPAIPFYMFVSYYLSLNLAFACSYLGWYSECGMYATVWLIAEAVGVTLIIKGLMIRKSEQKISA